MADRPRRKSQASRPSQSGGASVDETERRGSLVPPFVGAIASLIVPGLGQMFAREVRRGLVILGSMITLLGLLAWRVNLLARNRVGIAAKLSRALQRSPGFIIILLGGIVILWLIKE